MWVRRRKGEENKENKEVDFLTVVEISEPRPYQLTAAAPAIIAVKDKAK